MKSKCIEWCGSCCGEVEINRVNEYQKCPSCEAIICPCSMYSHGDVDVSEDVEECICYK